MENTPANKPHLSRFRVEMRASAVIYIDLYAEHYQHALQIANTLERNSNIASRPSWVADSVVAVPVHVPYFSPIDWTNLFSVHGIEQKSEPPSD